MPRKEFVMQAYYITLLCGVASVCIFLIFRVKKHMLKAVVTKAASSAFFILTALSAAYKLFSEKLSAGGSADISEIFPYVFFLIGGLLGGLLGDIWLDLKFCHTISDRSYTYAGFTCFGVGHIFFFCALVFAYGFVLKNAIIAFVVSACVAAIVFFTEKLMKLKYGEFKAISVIYCFFMFFSTIYALTICLFSEGEMPKAALVMNIGGVFFIISDFILSGTYFGEGKNRSVDVILNHVTYYIAQYTIASSILFL